MYKYLNSKKEVNFSVIPSSFQIRGLALVLISVIFNFTSCNTDSNLLKYESKSNSNDNPHAKYLQLKKLGNEILPRGTKYTISESLDYLNDGMNFLYCRPQEYFLETLIYLDTFFIPVLSSEIDEADLISTMDDIAEFGGDKFDNETRTEKAPLLFSIRQLSSTSSEFIRIEAAFFMEAGAVFSTTDEYPYADSWIYGEWNQNVSNTCNHEVIDRDAADLIRRDIRRNLVHRNTESAYYFRDPYGKCFSGGESCLFCQELTPQFPINDTDPLGELENPVDDIEGDNLYDYLIFYNNENYSNYDECLSVNEMNFYYDAMADMATSVLPNPIGNKVIGLIEVGYSANTSFADRIWHAMEVMTVSKIVVLDEEYEEALPLP